MRVVHCFYFLMFVYMDHVSELKLMYDVCFYIGLILISAVVHIELENVAIIAMYCHLRPPDATAFPT